MQDPSVCGGKTWQAQLDPQLDHKSDPAPARAREYIGGVHGPQAVVLGGYSTDADSVWVDRWTTETRREQNYQARCFF